MNIIVRRSAPGQVEPSANPSTRFAAPVKEYPLEVALAAAPRPKGDVNALVRLAEVDMAAVHALILDRMQSDVPIIPKLAEHLVSAGGKRLRPLLTVAAARASGAGDDIASPKKLAAAVEFIHTATLLHDDVLDHARVRRKVPTLNALHGNEVPVLLGDMIYARTFDLSLKLPTLVAAREMSLMTQNLCRGEIDQNFFKFDGHPDEKRYFSVIKAKTASMFKSSCFLGIHYGGGTDAHEGTDGLVLAECLVLSS